MHFHSNHFPKDRSTQIRLGFVKSTSWFTMPLLIVMAMIFIAGPAVPSVTADGIQFVGDETEQTKDVAFGDWDGDGDLDMAVANDDGDPNRIYENINGKLTLDLVNGIGWESAEADDSRGVEWGDWDGDGDLDLAVANYGESNRVYENTGTDMQLAWSSNDASWTNSVAFGDWDGDGDLDLAAGNSVSQANRVYENIGGDLDADSIWESPESDQTQDIAWGDIDNDGDLDLLVGNSNSQQLRMYRNGGGSLALAWSSPMTHNSYGIDIGDWDNDGDMDLAVAAGGPESFGESNYVYENNLGVLTLDVGNGYGWVSTEVRPSTDVAFGDWDGDGDLDLAVANTHFNGTITGQFNRIYENDGGMLKLDVANDFGYVIESSTQSNTVEWGDIDNDGDLELGVGNNGFNRVYDVGQHGVTLELDSTLGYSSPFSDGGRDGEDLAFGDWDGDGDLDVAVANFGSNNHIEVFEYESGWFYLDPDNDYGWKELLPNGAYSTAWGDWDADGDLDLAVGTTSFNYVYENHNGTLVYEEGSFGWQSPEENQTYSVAWADWDGDGDLDLAAGNLNGNINVFENIAGNLQFDPENKIGWQSGFVLQTYDLAWGDWDADGDPDLAVAQYGAANIIFENTDSGDLQLDAGNGVGWRSTDAKRTTSTDWADWDGDGDLDLAFGNSGQFNQVYENVGDDMRLDTVAGYGWESSDVLTTHDIAWGDYDGDGDADLAVVNGNYTPDSFSRNMIVENVGGDLVLDPEDGFGWESTYLNNTRAVAWADWDNDGDLDLGVANTNSQFAAGRYFRIFENTLNSPDQQRNHTQGVVVESPLSSAGADDFGVAEILDEDVISIPYRLHNSNGSHIGRIEASFSTDGGDNWQPAVPTDDTQTTHLEAGIREVYHSGDLNLPQAIEDDGSAYYSRMQVPGNGTITDVNVWLNIDHTFVSDLNVWLHSPGGTWVELIDDAGAGGDNFVGTIIDDEGALPVTFGSAPFSGSYNPVSSLSNFDGQNARGEWWLYVIDQAANDTGDLVSWGLEITTDDQNGEQVFKWDTFASGFFGQSDNVVFRIEAFPQPETSTDDRTYIYENGLPDNPQRPSTSSVTLPIRVRGTQVRVFEGDDLESRQPTADAIVYQLLDGQITGAELMANPLTAELYETNGSGYLAGRSPVNVGDTLFALLPVETADHYTLYHTSAAPTTIGLAGHEVTAPGVQELTVSSDNPLILFNLDISLEWDARQDTTFLAELDNSLARTSEILFDVSNGQMALGDVHVYHDKENWLSADMVIFARNNIRPRATMGGVVDAATDELGGVNGVIEDAYFPGQVSMGPIWDPFGENQFDLGQDWWRTLAHELAHYFLFVPDNYIGVGDAGLEYIDCQGSFMTNTYDDGYSEFLTQTEWDADPVCLESVAEFTTGRSDWETIVNFYPALDGTGGNNGPTSLPLAVTDVSFAEPVSTQDVLAAKNFDLRSAADNQILLAPQAQAFVIKQNGTADQTDDRLIPLGTSRASGDRVKVRGASVGDQVCVFDLLSEPPLVGCETVAELSSAVLLSEAAGWTPEITVTPVNSVTFDVEVVVPQTVTGIRAQLYPAYGAPGGGSVTAPLATLSTADNLTFTGQFTVSDPTFTGHVRVWDTADESRTAVTEFVLNTDVWGGNLRAWGGNLRAWGAPTSSPDGQLVVSNAENPFDESGVSTLAAVSSPPAVPNWLTLVGQAYDVQLASGAPDVTRSLAFDYLQRDVPAGYEDELSIYFLPSGGSDGEWQRLETTLDTLQNRAIAIMPSSENGIFALMVTVELPPFDTGWNLFGYPINETRPITDALASIDGSYNSVYTFEPDGGDGVWRLYDVTVVDEHPEYASFVNDLESLVFGNGYWIYATEPVTTYLGVESTAVRSTTAADRRAPEDGTIPPATYYGPVATISGFTPAAGMIVTAEIDEVECGRSVLADVNGTISYRIQITADRADGCGQVDSGIMFYIDGLAVLEAPTWDNSHAQYLELTPSGPAEQAVYLPFVTRE